MPEQRSIVRGNNNLCGARFRHPCGTSNGRYDGWVWGKNRNGGIGYTRAKRGEVIVAGSLCTLGKIIRRDRLWRRQGLRSTRGVWNGGLSTSKFSFCFSTSKCAPIPSTTPAICPSVCGDRRRTAYRGDPISVPVGRIHPSESSSLPINLYIVPNPVRGIKEPASTHEIGDGPPVDST